MIHIGTSGYNYPEWKGHFYPATLPVSKMLPYYAAQFTTVEINFTFYRMPTETMLANWAKATPDGFRFTLKAPRRITHDAKLRGVESLARQFCDVAGTLGPKLGALLFQLPPSLKKDTACLGAFLQTLPPGAPAAFEFRHDSWLDEEVFDALRQRGVALCVADSETRSTPDVATAAYAYYRLRDEGYTDSDLERWAGVVGRAAADGRDTFVYFKHEEAGKGPVFAKRLAEFIAAG